MINFEKERQQAYKAGTLAAFYAKVIEFDKQNQDTNKTFGANQIFLRVPQLAEYFNCSYRRVHALTENKATEKYFTINEDGLKIINKRDLFRLFKAMTYAMQIFLKDEYKKYYDIKARNINQHPQPNIKNAGGSKII